MTVEVRVDEGRADLVLRRPDVLNAIDWDTFGELSEAVDEIASTAGVRVVVVSGEGRSFSSGLDTSSLQGSTAAQNLIAHAQAGYRKLLLLEMPTIAAVRGHALGAGLQLALVCDLRVVAADASLGLLEARYGLVPDLGGTQRLPSLIGPGRAKKMIWLAERIDGAEAERIGLAEVSVPEPKLEAAVDDLAARIVAAPPRVVREVKRLVDAARLLKVSHGMDAEATAQARMFASPDFAEAVTSFVENRPPRFSDD